MTVESIEINKRSLEQIVISIAAEDSKKSRTTFQLSTPKRSLVWNIKNLKVSEDQFKLCVKSKKEMKRKDCGRNG